MAVRERRPLAWTKLALAGSLLAIAGGGAHAQACPLPPAAIRDLDMARPYSDVVGSVASAELQARHADEAAPLKDYLTHVTRDADRAAAERDSTAAQCALAWLDAWARGGALLGDMRSKQAEYERKWDTGGFAIAYLKVRGAASQQQRVAIEPWLKSLAAASRRFFDDPGHKRNNHWYWLGLGLGAVGSATGDDELWSAAHAIYRDALADVAADGTLPLELARGTRALHYNAFALMPLVTLAELAAVRGEDWWGERGGALHRLVALTLAGLDDPATFDRRAGLLQERPVNAHAGWIALYAARFPDRVPARLPASKPSHRWLGGDVRNLSLGVPGSRPR